MSADSFFGMNIKAERHYKQDLRYYIPGLIAGKYTLQQVADSTGYSVQWLCKLKKRYAKYGEDCFVNGNKGRIAPNKTSEDFANKILVLYASDYSGLNFKYFCECLAEYEDIHVSYPTLRRIMASAGIKSPEAHKIKKKKVHRPRLRRASEGDLLQLDGTPYQWFQRSGDNKYYDLMGAIDDATGKITGLYMTNNECLYGYCEVMRQTFSNYGRPREVYSDRAAIFCVTPKNKKELTVWEQLAGIHDKKTQWQRILEELNIKQILAWSPQAKGRVERMWGTIQKRLPFWLYKQGITTMEGANKAMPRFIEYFNSHFSVEARAPEIWLPVPDNIDDILCAQIPRFTDTNGCFSFHSYKFAVVGCSRISRKTFLLCISERGIFAKVDGKYYPVKMLDEYIYDVVSNDVPQVLQDIIYRYLYADQKEVSA